MGILVLLFISFYLFFGKESINKFLVKSTFTIKEKIDFNQEAPPSVTVCPQKHGVGWNTSKRVMHSEEFEILCNGSTTLEKALQCIRDNTFNLTESVDKAYLSYLSTQIQPSAWDTDITVLTAGQCVIHSTIPTL